MEHGHHVSQHISRYYREETDHVVNEPMSYLEYVRHTGGISNVGTEDDYAKYLGSQSGRKNFGDYLYATGIEVKSKHDVRGKPNAFYREHDIIFTTRGAYPFTLSPGEVRTAKRTHYYMEDLPNTPLVVTNARDALYLTYDQGYSNNAGYVPNPDFVGHYGNEIVYVYMFPESRNAMNQTLKKREPGLTYVDPHGHIKPMRFIRTPLDSVTADLNSAGATSKKALRDMSDSRKDYEKRLADIRANFKSLHVTFVPYRDVKIPRALTEDEAAQSEEPTLDSELPQSSVAADSPTANETPTSTDAARVGRKRPKKKKAQKVIRVPISSGAAAAPKPTHSWLRPSKPPVKRERNEEPDQYGRARYTHRPDKD